MDKNDRIHKYVGITHFITFPMSEIRRDDTIAININNSKCCGHTYCPHFGFFTFKELGWKSIGVCKLQPLIVTRLKQLREGQLYTLYARTPYCLSGQLKKEGGKRIRLPIPEKIRRIWEYDRY